MPVPVLVSTFVTGTMTIARPRRIANS
jgi:hypothetical protein